MDMKKFTVIILAVVSVLSSCTDYLNVKPRGYDIASRIEHYQGLLYGSDFAILDESYPYMCMECYTDVDGYNNAYSTVGSYVCEGYKWSKDIYREDQTCGEWNSFTTVLYNYNVIISEVMDAVNGTEAEKRALLAEARVLRAWCTFMMSSFFGEVPIITTASTQNPNFELRSIDEVNSFILTELEESVDDLADAPEHFYRVFKTSGHAIYGKILFMMGRYEEARVQLENCMECLKNQPSLRLIDFKPLIDANGDIDYPVRQDVNTERLFYVMSMPRLWDAVYGSMYGQLMFGVRNDLLERFFPDKKDCRLAFISSISSGNSAYKSYKAKDKYCANMSNIASNAAIDLSEVYTMLAECLARKGETDAAADLLVELRSTRMDTGHEGIPSDVVSRDDMIRFAFAERMREQFGFGSSWFDMKRLWNDPLFQDLKPLYVHTVGEETYTLTEDRLYLEYPPTVLQWHPEYKKQ